MSPARSRLANTALVLLSLAVTYLAASFFLFRVALSHLPINLRPHFPDTRPALRAAAGTAGIHGPRDWNHFNDAGYRVLGETLAQTIDDADSTGCVDWN